MPDRRGDASLRRLPKVDLLLNHPTLAPYFDRHPRTWIVDTVQGVIDNYRSAIRAGKQSPPSLEELVTEISRVLENTSRWSLRRVVNATGIVIHTNLGRSPLSRQAIERITEVAEGYGTLEYNLEQGSRGDRSSHVEQLLRRLTGAEAALVVNNNAAAVLLSLSTLALGKEAIVSRGELVEIGGAFRMPDVMAASGTILREVGTTNKTYLDDYRRAINPETGLLLKIHTSNYRVVGFTHQVPREELVALGKETGIPFMEDVGSGYLTPIEGISFQEEPTVQGILSAGVDLVTFSGDKLLGGPQAGIILGKKDLVAKIRSHPMHRAVRIDKLTLAALEGTLWHYLEGPEGVAAVPTLAMITAPADFLRRRSRKIVKRFLSIPQDRVEISIDMDVSQVGGGALPLWDIPTPVIVLRPRGFNVERLEEAFRKAPVPVIGRVREGAYLLNLRTVRPEEEKDLIKAFREAVSIPVGQVGE